MAAIRNDAIDLEPFAMDLPLNRRRAQDGKSKTKNIQLKEVKEELDHHIAPDTDPEDEQETSPPASSSAGSLARTLFNIFFLFFHYFY